MRTLLAASLLLCSGAASAQSPDNRRAEERALFEKIVEIPTVYGRLAEFKKMTALLASEFREAGMTSVVKDHDGTQTIIATNDDWWNSAQGDQTAELGALLGAFPLKSGSADSVVLRLCEPGVYSAIISPSDSTPGVALAEIYQANSP